MTRAEATPPPSTPTHGIGTTPSPTTGSSSRTITLTYERGTILVSGSPWRIEQLRVPELRWDRRVGAYRLPAYRYQALLSAIAAQRVPLDDLASRWARRTRIRLSAPRLRDYQRHALTSWENAQRRGIVQLPTGSGKTLVAHGAIAAVDRPTLILVPTRALLGQWAQGLTRGPTQAEVSRLGDGAHAIGPLTVATFAAAERHVEELGERFELLIVDEAHHLAARNQGELLELFVAPLRLGLTATPPTSRDNPLGLARLERRLGPVVHRERTSALVSAGHLAGFDLQRLDVDLDPAERVAYERARETATRARIRLAGADGILPTWKTIMARARRRGPDENASLAEAFAARRQLRQIAGRAAAKRRLAARLLQQLGRDARTLIFCADNEATYATSRELLVPAITCETTRREREDLLADFRRGTIRALVSARVLGEGLDLPEANAALILGSAAGGSREPVQRIGRLLRPMKGRRAIVYELVARGTFESAEATSRQLALVS